MYKFASLKSKFYLSIILIFIITAVFSCSFLWPVTTFLLCFMKILEMQCMFASTSILCKREMLLLYLPDIVSVNTIIIILLFWVCCMFVCFYLFFVFCFFEVFFLVSFCYIFVTLKICFDFVIYNNYCLWILKDNYF